MVDCGVASTLVPGKSAGKGESAAKAKPVHWALALIAALHTIPITPIQCTHPPEHICTLSHPPMRKHRCDGWRPPDHTMIVVVRGACEWLLGESVRCGWWLIVDV